MKPFTYEELIQALTQIETTLTNLSDTPSVKVRPIATANIKSYRQAAFNLKKLYIKFLEAKKTSTSKISKVL